MGRELEPTIYARQLQKHRTCTLDQSRTVTSMTILSKKLFGGKCLLDLVITT